MSFHLELKNSIIEYEKDRYCEIYKITNLTNQKVYIGQAVSHILNHKKYRPYGMEGRFRCHISEAFSNKKNQCHYLNNAIRKYGSSNFSLQLIKNCSLEHADEIEKEEIFKNNSLFPNGYNLNTGGKKSIPTEESKKRVSNGVLNYYRDKKIHKFSNIIIEDIDEDFEKYVRPLNRNKIQYGWYVYIQRKKVDFGGVHISLDESKKMALDFIYELKYSVKHLDAGNPLEPSLPLSYGNIEEELG
jgi:hypothetical protein